MRDLDWDDLQFLLAISERGGSRTRLAQGQGSSARGRAQGEESERGGRPLYQAPPAPSQPYITPRES